MKKITYKITGVILMFSMMLSSCTKDFEEINTDPNNTPNALPQQLLAPALVGTLQYNMLRNRNFNNELMQVSVDMGDGDGKVFRYDYRSTWADYLYNGWYSELTNFKDLYKIASDELNYNKSYIGISLICQSWIYSMLTDTYGDIPYFESNQARDLLNYEPKFDAQKDIYFDIFKKLEEANTLLAANTAIVASSDPVYQGNIAKWRKFGNSLYLRLLLRVSGKAEVADAAIAKIKEIVEVNPGSYPIMQSNDESAILKWTGVAPYTSPLLTVREQDFRALGIATFFISHLVDWNDPRIDIPTYGSNGINRWGIAPYQGAYLGVPSGYAPGENPEKKSYFYSNTSTSSIMTEPLAGMIMNYAELKFILAEAAAKGWVSSSAETYYNDGALNSITLWLPTWSVPITTFLAAADIQWDNNATLDEKMEKIHLLKYYALFLTDMQQWFEYRRTGHPVLPKGAGLRNNGEMPSRMTYPVYVQSTNPTRYKEAVTAQGSDVISTKVWWQKP
ncbi:SusD/RagB family nutrient-binding outer membrane lipoprotein [Chitinophagaceae bacterium LB-8]|uniref:SusD/RagB family nutrient-binding outer membrane lipoprotein n=1 Tax=Paraflavisolibacter caeni TaxID=2982496 RepID=A0A9X3BH10_9BACT|nr:SusD/RagB family nutrient-binding outer membrane lipoprotein [Paraflavisolibacter caeni]MCU7548303.1 SusD/RagB family nutrient-binding outer membrane lipoprotein [Paraflavisolibacter caeni]